MSRSDLNTALDLGLVIAGHGRHYVVETPEGRRLHAHGRGKRSECVVGDRVRYLPTSPGEGVIEHVEPRRNLLMRQDEWRTKSFAANIDRLIVLVSGEPMFSESQLARALIAARVANIPVSIALNKTDLPAATAARERLQPYRNMGEDLIELSLRQRPDEARQTLTPLLAGGATLVLGPSGSGKSSLINRMVPEAQAQVGDISHALRSGKHTTTTTQWYWIDRDSGTALIDSPGFQEFGLQHIAASSLPALMRDLERHASDCRFYNCTHRQEPGCAVRAAQERGEITASRYRIYEEIHEELSSARRW